jgi:ABC-type sugar transport system permease subunit
MLIYLAGLQNVPAELYDAAKVDGANWFLQHRHVTLPLIGPSSLFVFVVSIIQSFKVFTQIYLMTEGGPGYSSNVLIYYTYEYGFKFWQLGRASTLTSIMILILMFLILMVFSVFERRVTYQAG